MTQQAEVALPETKEVDLGTKLIQKLLENSQRVTAEYKVLVGHTGAYLTGSMAAAHARGYNDALKVILKEIQNGKETK